MFAMIMVAAGGALTVPSRALRYSAPTLRVQSAVRCRANFGGEWEMDLDASDQLGPTLRALGVNRVLAAVITRLGVRQSISQTDEELRIQVKTRVSESEIQLRFDGATTRTPGISGGTTDTTSRWLDDERLETRQALDDPATLAPADESASVFVTVRSLLEDGRVLQEACSVVRQGELVPGASAARLLRRAE